jgi:hypothetical protein
MNHDHDLAKELDNKKCAACDWLGYYDGYYCRCDDNSDTDDGDGYLYTYDSSNCQYYIKRVGADSLRCSATQDDYCQFWCSDCLFSVKGESK